MIKQMHKIEESVAFIWQYLGQGSIIYYFSRMALFTFGMHVTP